jgi:hypothetical protein
MTHPLKGLLNYFQFEKLGKNSNRQFCQNCMWEENGQDLKGF